MATLMMCAQIGVLLIPNSGQMENLGTSSMATLDSTHGSTGLRAWWASMTRMGLEMTRMGLGMTRMGRGMASSLTEEGGSQDTLLGGWQNFNPCTGSLIVGSSILGSLILGYSIIGFSILGSLILGFFILGFLILGFQNNQIDHEDGGHGDGWLRGCCQGGGGGEGFMKGNSFWMW